MTKEACQQILRNTAITVYLADWLVRKMKKREALTILTDEKQDFIETITPKKIKNHDGKRFTRKRLLFLSNILAIILRCSPFSLQIRLDDYYKAINCVEETVSKQAFSKARTYLDPEIVRKSFQLTARTLSSCEDLELYREKYRLCAVDGSNIALDNATVLLEHFGGSGSKKDCATALASICYDPLNNIILDGGLYPYGTSERYAAGFHFREISKLPLPEGAKNLFIFDRGYPSKELLAEMIDADMCFLMRVRRKFNVDFDLSKGNEKVSFNYNGKRYQVRVFKIVLDSGETEILITNLRALHLSKKEVGDLYFKRWGIEVKFDSLKNKLELENMSGRRVVTTYQDFWAKLDLANTLAALEFQTDAIIDERNDASNNKYMQRTNENRLITKFSERYLEVLVTENRDERMTLLNELIKDIARRPVEVKPDRKYERKPPRKKKFCDRRKRVLR